MKGYPAGTKCVITWNVEYTEDDFQIGEIVTVGADFHRVDGRYSEPCRKAAEGLLTQRIVDTEVGYLHDDCYYPVAWMRPLSDPDATPIEESEELEA